MSKIIYTLSSTRNQDVGLGSIGILSSNQQKTFTVEEDSSDEVLIGQMISQGLVNLVSAVPVQSAYGPANLTISQVSAVQGLVSGAGLTGATYDGSGRLISYTSNGVPHTITYPTTTTAIISNAAASRSVTFDGSGRVSSIS